MLSAESVGGMSIWTFSDNFPQLSAAEAFEVYVLYVQGDKENCYTSMMALALEIICVRACVFSPA